MRCWHCKGDHASVAQVKACAGLGEATGVTREDDSPAAIFRQNAAKLPDLEHARYALKLLNLSGEWTWHFYKVDKPREGRWAGYTFVNVQAGSEYYPLRPFANASNVLSIIARDPQKALADYGHELGECGVCGRTLTNPESIAAGIGPICAGRL